MGASSSTDVLISYQDFLTFIDRPLDYEIFNNLTKSTNGNMNYDTSKALIEEWKDVYLLSNIESHEIISEINDSLNIQNIFSSIHKGIFFNKYNFICFLK